jgi:AraC-like DNA-binding protein
MANTTTPPPAVPLDPDRAARPLFVLHERIAAGSGPLHCHRRHQLIYAADGVVTVTADRGWWVVPPQRAVWVPAGTPHQVAAGAPFALCSLYVATRLRRDWPAGCRVVAVPPLLRELLLEAADFGDRYPARGAQRRLLEVAVDRIATLDVAPLALEVPHDPRARRVAEALRADPSERRLLADWGRQVGASARSLERLFLRDTGMSFARWRAQLRLLAALERLGAGRSVTQVALDVGYDDPSSFIAAFKRTLGVTPRRYFRTTAVTTVPRAAAGPRHRIDP